ncbi:MAG: hypothetical protein AAF517_25730 [Planctomycetota bacterium]
MTQMALHSNSGRYALGLSVTGVTGAAWEVSVIVRGCRFGPDGEDLEMGAEIDGVTLSSASLNKLARALRVWVELPLEELASHRFEGDFQLGVAPGECLDLEFGPREDLIADGHEVVTVRLRVERFDAKYSFRTDPSCLREFVEGIEAALREVGLQP